MTEQLNLYNLLIIEFGLSLLWCVVMEIHVIVISLTVDDCLQSLEDLESQNIHKSRKEED